MTERGASATERRPRPKQKAASVDSQADASGPEASGLAARKAAARLLATVIDARTPLDGMTDHEHGHPMFRALDMRDRGLVRAILATALRFRRTIEALLAKRLERPLPRNASALQHILHVAAAQILFLDIPDSAAVDLAVRHAKSDSRTTRFSGLVNGVLRTLARAKDTDLPSMLASMPDAPDWFVQRLQTAYGREKMRQILSAHRLQARVDISVKADPGLWAERLGGVVLPTGSVRLARLDDAVTALPGFSEGEWWVQDAAAALPARLFGDVAGLRIADLCAAPGGKTAQLVSAGANVTAVDASKNRLDRLAENLGRLRLQAQLVEADLFEWTPSTLFDAVLLDAPCSSTGTVRRHPDVPWTKSLHDIEKLAALQRRMLERAVALVKPGGAIVFSNCSLDPLEGEEMVRSFLAQNGSVGAGPVRPGEIPMLDPYLSAEGHLRTTPADLPLETAELSGMDGFFAARLRRLA